MTEPATSRICIYPGCDRPAVPPDIRGGPQPAFCDREDHNAFTTHQALQRLDQTLNHQPERSGDDG